VKLWGTGSRIENTLIASNGYVEPPMTPSGEWVQLLIEGQPPRPSFDLVNVTVYDGASMNDRSNYIATFNYHDLNGYVDPDEVPTTVRMRNCIFQGVQPPIGIGDSNTVFADHCLFYLTGNGDGIQVKRVLHDTLVTGTIDASQLNQFGAGNLYADALFMAPAWGTIGDYHLRNGSPAIDKGAGGERCTIR
jgi:hypothetical protein